MKALGGNLSDVVRTRVIVEKREDVEAVCIAHGWSFGSVGIRPANTLVISSLVGEEYSVKIEAEAVVGCGKENVLRI